MSMEEPYRVMRRRYARGHGRPSHVQPQPSSPVRAFNVVSIDLPQLNVITKSAVDLQAAGLLASFCVFTRSKIVVHGDRYIRGRNGNEVMQLWHHTPLRSHSWMDLFSGNPAWTARHSISQSSSDVIAAWQHEHPGARMVILDPHKVLGPDGRQHPNWIQVNTGFGLMPFHLHKACTKLGLDWREFRAFSEGRSYKKATPSME